MAVVGTVQLIAFGFDSQSPLPPDVVERMQRLRGDGVIRFVDALFVAKDARGVLRLRKDGTDLDVSSDPPGSTLWQLLGRDALDAPPTTPLELHSSCERGLDLEAVEGLAYLIEPGTSALLILVETRWATDLLDAIVASGGFPIVTGCLEPETMLVVGPALAAAVEARSAMEVTAEADGIAMLDALACAPDVSSAVAAELVRALVVARFIDPGDVSATINALADARIVSLQQLTEQHRRVGMADDNLDELGPVDYLVVEFPGSKFNGEIAPALVDLVDRGIIRILDLIIITKEPDGSFDAIEINDFEEGVLGELHRLETEIAELLSADDIANVAAALEPGSTAGVLVYENQWAAPFASAVRHCGGQLVANGRIPVQALIAAFEADEEEGA